MKRINKDNPKLKAFGILADKMKALGFESMVVFAAEKNDGSGKTYLSVKHGDGNMKEDRAYEKTIIRLLGILGTTPKEIKDTLDGLEHIRNVGQLAQLVDNLRDRVKK